MRRCGWVLKSLLAMIFAGTIFLACKDNSISNPYLLEISFDHRVDNDGLEIDGKKYISPASDTFTVTELRYYVSNIVLRNSKTGDLFREKNSYHLIDVKGKKLSFGMKEIPENTYDELLLAIGVDSLKNNTIDNDGDLDPNNDMYWGWNTGYKFISFLGHYNGQQGKGGLSFHIGENENYKTLIFPLGNTFLIKSGESRKIKFSVNVNEIFKNPNLIDFDQLRSAQSGPNAKKISENYAKGMLQIVEVK